MKIGHKIVITDCTVSFLVGKMGTIVEVDRGNRTTRWPFLVELEDKGSYWYYNKNYWCNGIPHSSLIEGLL